jgi:hypothetical protein
MREICMISLMGAFQFGGERVSSPNQTTPWQIARICTIHFQFCAEQLWLVSVKLYSSLEVNFFIRDMHFYFKFGLNL